MYQLDDLCLVCQGLKLEVLKSTAFELCSDARQLRDKAEALNYTRCEMCAIIWWSLRYDQWKIPLDGSTESWLVMLYSKSTRRSFGCVEVVAMPTKRRKDDILFMLGGSWHYGPPDDKPWCVRGSLAIYGIPGMTDIFRRSNCAELTHAIEHPRVFGDMDFEYYITNEGSGAPPCRQLVSSWLDICATRHLPICQTEDAKYPTRLLEVTAEDGSASLRLFTPPTGATGRYIALSYCWGRASSLRLQSDNIEALHNSVHMQTLPRTIQDAVTLVRFLGIRYLWVDALCIIQGHDKAAVQDWLYQSRLMHKVFGGAWLTIMAAAGISSDAGLFTNRSAQSEIWDKGVRMSVDSKSLEYVVLGPVPEISTSAKEPLEARGWAFQEAILSKRQLKYGTSRMSWKCRSCQCHENISEPFIPADLADSPTNRKEMAAYLYDQWTKVVELYSGTQLTYKSDRLPAISGLAGIVGEEGDPFSSSQYHFGVWEGSRIQQLLWRHDGCVVNGQRRYQRQNDYRAPSWSWASVDGAIKFLKPDSLAKPGKIRMLSLRDSSLIFRGQMAQASSLRLRIKGKSTGLVENHEPWKYLDTYLETYLDELESIPDEHKKTPANEPHELIDVWLLFLNKSQGLILLACEDDWGHWKRVLSNALSRIASSNLSSCLKLSKVSRKLQRNIVRISSGPKYRRIGAFTGSLSPSAWELQTRTGQIV